MSLTISLDANIIIMIKVLPTIFCPLNTSSIYGQVKHIQDSVCWLGLISSYNKKGRNHKVSVFKL